MLYTATIVDLKNLNATQRQSLEHKPTAALLGRKEKAFGEAGKPTAGIKSEGKPLLVTEGAGARRIAISTTATTASTGREANAVHEHETDPFAKLEQEMTAFRYNHKSAGPRSSDEINALIEKSIRHQSLLFASYYDLLDTYKDAREFIKVHRGQSEEQLAAEIERYDAGRMRSDQIGPKLDEYYQASANIQRKNGELARNIALLRAKLSAHQRQDFSDTAIDSGLNAMSELAHIQNAFSTITQRNLVEAEAIYLVGAEQSFARKASAVQP